jgi:hypothetical protein
MKRVFMACSILLIAVSTMASVPPKVNSFVQRSLTEEFKGAENVSWLRIGDLTEAIFDWNGVRSQAFFDDNGDLKAFAQAVEKSYLPQKTKQLLSSKYNGYKIIEVTKMESVDNDSNYYILLESEQNKIILQADTAGRTNVFSRVNK